MENFLTCINILAPIFLLVGLGYWLKVRQVIDQNFIDKGVHLVFYVLLPCSLFMNIYGSEFSAIFNPGLVAFVVLIHLAVTSLLAWVLPHFVKDREQCGVTVQGCFRGNVLLLGLPLAYNMYGADGVGPTSLIMAYSIPLYNILAVVVLTMFSGEKRGKIHWKEVLLGICKNPLVVGTVLAIPFAVFRLPLPQIATDVIADLGSIGSPLGLLLLGAQMKFSTIRENRKPLFLAIVFKLVLFPLICMALAALLGFNDQELGAVFILVSAPMSISSFIMARTMTRQGELAGQMVFLSTAFSMLTLLGGLYLLTCFGILS